jgi:hypothetical protein
MVVEKQWPWRIIVVLCHFGWGNYQGRLWRQLPPNDGRWKKWPLRIIVVLGHFGWENYQGRLWRQLPPDDGRMTETFCGSNIGREEELLCRQTHNCFVTQKNVPLYGLFYVYHLNTYLHWSVDSSLFEKELMSLFQWSARRYTPEEELIVTTTRETSSTLLLITLFSNCLYL